MDVKFTHPGTSFNTYYPVHNYTQNDQIDAESTKLPSLPQVRSYSNMHKTQNTLANTRMGSKSNQALQSRSLTAQGIKFIKKAGAANLSNPASRINYLKNLQQQ